MVRSLGSSIARDDMVHMPELGSSATDPAIAPNFLAVYQLERRQQSIKVGRCVGGHGPGGRFAHELIVGAEELRDQQAMVSQGTVQCGETGGKRRRTHERENEAGMDDIESSHRKVRRDLLEGADVQVRPLQPIGAAPTNGLRGGVDHAPVGVDCSHLVPKAEQQHNLLARPAANVQRRCTLPQQGRSTIRPRMGVPPPIRFGASAKRPNQQVTRGRSPRALEELLQPIG